MNRNVTLKLDKDEVISLQGFLKQYASSCSVNECSSLIKGHNRLVESLINDAYKMGREDGKDG